VPRDRFFTPGVRAAGDRVVLPPDDARKLLTVLRRASGDRIEIVDGGGVTFAARLAIEGKTVHALLETPLAEVAPAESGARIVLAQAIPKGQKMDFIVEKATELGVSAIVPLRSERVTGEHTGEHKHERWQRIAKSAAAQSGRARIPQIEEIAGWPALRASFGAYDRIYLPWEAAPPAPLRERFEADAASASAVLIIIGPEGGFGRGEVAAAVAAGAVTVSLGTRILRTETAALAVIAAWLYARGEL
jgi:16S rRNA (uracil1498-N3)-methyltransferase